MGRGRSCKKEINKGTWSKEEDEILFNYVTRHGEGKWQEVAQSSGLKRCAKSCRYRYLNYLKLGIKRGDISEDEQILIIRLHHQLGNRWSLIAKRLPGRTDIEIKNYWKIYLSKKLHHQHKSKKKKTKILEDNIIIELSDHSTNINPSSSNIQTENDDDDDDAPDDFLLNNIDQNDQVGNIVNDLNSKIQEVEEHEKKDEKVGRHGLKGAWSRKEDEILSSYVALHGEGKWNKVAQRTGLKRCGKSCRHRYLHYLKPGIKRGNISENEEDMIIRLHCLYGNRWTLIAKKLPGRTDSEIKNHWHAYLSKKLQEQPKSSPSLKHHQHKPEDKKAEQINSAYTPEVPLPTSANTKNLDDNIIGLSECDHNTNTVSPSSFQIEYDHAFLDDFLFDIFQNDHNGDDLNFNIPQIEDHNVVGISSSFTDHQFQFSEDVMDFWTSSEFPFFD